MGLLWFNGTIIEMVIAKLYGCDALFLHFCLVRVFYYCITFQNGVQNDFSSFGKLLQRDRKTRRKEAKNRK